MPENLTTIIQQLLDKLASQGYVLNPKAQINEQSIDELLTIAGKEINPYYQTQLKLVSDDLKKSLGYSQQQVLESEANLERRYGRSLRDIGAQTAEIGFAQSGQRIEQERELAGETQRAIEQGRRGLQFGAEKAVGGFARQFAGAPGFQLPSGTLPGAPRVLPGQAGFERGAESAFYELSPDIYTGLIGEQEFQRRGVIRTRASELEEAQRLGQTLPLRTLNI